MKLLILIGCLVGAILMHIEYTMCLVATLWKTFRQGGAMWWVASDIVWEHLHGKQREITATIAFIDPEKDELIAIDVIEIGFNTQAVFSEMVKLEAMDLAESLASEESNSLCSHISHQEMLEKGELEICVVKIEGKNHYWEENFSVYSKEFSILEPENG